MTFLFLPHLILVAQKGWAQHWLIIVKLFLLAVRNVHFSVRLAKKPYADKDPKAVQRLSAHNPFQIHFKLYTYHSPTLPFLNCFHKLPVMRQHTVYLKTIMHVLYTWCPKSLERVKELEKGTS